MDKNLLTKKEASEYINMSFSFVSKLVFNKKIEYIKIGKSVRIQKEALDKYIKECKEHSPKIN